MRQIEQMESEELLAQKKLRTEVIQLEDMLAQVHLHLLKLLLGPLAQLLIPLNRPGAEGVRDASD